MSSRKIHSCFSVLLTRSRMGHSACPVTPKDDGNYTGLAKKMNSDFPTEVLVGSQMGTTFGDGTALALETSLSETE